jgi:hypothetical protein
MKHLPLNKDLIFVVLMFLSDMKEFNAMDKFIWQNRNHLRFGTCKNFGVYQNDYIGLATLQWECCDEVQVAHFRIHHFVLLVLGEDDDFFDTELPFCGKVLGELRNPEVWRRFRLQCKV